MFPPKKIERFIIKTLAFYINQKSSNHLWVASHHLRNWLLMTFLGERVEINDYITKTSFARLFKVKISFKDILSTNTMDLIFHYICN